MSTIKWGNDEFSEWATSLSNGTDIVACARSLYNGDRVKLLLHGNVTQISTNKGRVYEDKSSIRWVVKFTGSISNLNFTFSNEKFPNFSLDQLKEARDFVDNFLIRIEKKC